MINARIRLLGSLRGLSGTGEVSLRLEDDATIRTLFERLMQTMETEELRRALLDPELNDPGPNTIILVNGREVSSLEGMRTRLGQDSEVVIIPVAHGG